MESETRVSAAPNPRLSFRIGCFRPVKPCCSSTAYPTRADPRSIVSSLCSLEATLWIRHARTRTGFIKRVHKPAMKRSPARRLGARLRPRLRMRS